MNNSVVDTSEALANYLNAHVTYCEPYGNGHINNTFLVIADKRYILQGINTSIFTRPDELMENIIGVTEHIRNKAAEDKERATLVIIPTLDGQNFFIDLVFYNYILKCFVLIDLKTNKITHQDVGHMDMYIRMYDELKRNEGDNPTIGIVLCSDTDEDIARYSVLNGNEQLFASKYKLYLPTEEELRAEIEAQKALFFLQQEEKNNN